MKEKIYNLYYIIENELIQRLGAVEHTLSGSDKEKTDFLQINVEKDLQNIKYFPVPDRFQLVDESSSTTIKGILRLETFNRLQEVGKAYELFSEVFDYYDTIREPLICYTGVKNGKPIVDYIRNIFNNEKLCSQIHFHSAPDYLIKYIDDKGFHIDELLNDDFMKAIKLLFNKGHYISATKLLLSAIDSFAFLEFGDEKNIFKIWVDQFLNLKELQITADEIWELRNSILHMTNYESRKVSKGQIKKLIIWIVDVESNLPNETSDGKYININKLYFETANAIEKWITSMKDIESFIKRYDLIISDSRYSKVVFKE
ncbi:MAG: hypothetical protein KAJ62_05940 [Desulfobacteraceae bacterium]|nr:hypothetical protein [Desulfobacteraceae bacterium]